MRSLYSTPFFAFWTADRLTMRTGLSSLNGLDTLRVGQAEHDVLYTIHCSPDLG